MNTSADGTPVRPLSRVAARMLARARRECDARQFGAAERSLGNVLALAPGHPDAMRLLATVAQLHGDHARAVECFRRVLDTPLEDFGLHAGLGVSLYELGDTDAAIVHLRRACEFQPASAPAWFNLGRALARQAYSDEAIPALERALELDPALLHARLVLARVYANLGRIDAAIATFRDVLKRDPGHAEAWFGLSSLNTYRFDAADEQRLQHALERRDLSTHDRELLAFACAKAHEHQDDYAGAFDLFALAAALRQQRVPWSAAIARRYIGAIRRAFSGEVPAPADPKLGGQVIFIASFPRSGSTLVEQILASHPSVAGANEIRALARVIDAENRRRGAAFPDWVADTDAAAWQRLGRDYLARTERWYTQRPRFTDKSLRTWPLVGAALAMLPSARVVIVRRDPVETCLGCFRQSFSETSGFPGTLADTADYYVDFARLMRHWRERYPRQVFDLEYEALVAAPEAVIRRLLDFCGLAFEPACLAFHRTSRAVLSLPSAAQVRQPIRRDTARSARYGNKLDDLRRRLQAPSRSS